MQTHRELPFLLRGLEASKLKKAVLFVLLFLFLYFSFWSEAGYGS